MREDIKDRWVTALRSGEYKQSKGGLRDANGFCCLGVLCDIAKADLGLEWESTSSLGGEFFSFAGDGGILPVEVVVWAGLKEADAAIFNNDGRRIPSFHPPSLNDQGTSFEAIADKIEQYWEKM